MATIQSSYELQQVVLFAKKKAREKQRPMLSLGILLANYFVPTSESLPALKKLSIPLDGPNGLIAAAAKLRRKRNEETLTEPEDTLKVMHRMACDSAGEYGVPFLNSVFYLLALLRIRKSAAFQVLLEAGVDVTRLRTELIARIAHLIRHGANGGAGAEPESPDEPLVVDEPPQSRPRPQPTEPKEPPAASSKATQQPIRGTAPLVKKDRPNGTSEAPAQKADVVDAATPPAPDALAEPLVKDPERFALNEDDFPVLCRLTHNITLDAARGGIDPVVGRDEEIGQMIRVLRKRRTNNPVLVGEPGVGKTALVEGLALDIVKETPRAQWLKDRLVLGLETGALVAGTQLRGSFSEKMRALRDEVKKSEGRVIIFIDEIHTIVGAGSGDSALDAANELKTVLARGEFPCIGATTLSEYKAHIEKDPALERRFQPVYVREPTQAQAVEICQGILDFYEKHHEVSYEPRSVEAAVRLSSRFILDRHLPDKAIDALDTAGAMAFVSGKDSVSEEDVARIIAEKVGIPMERLLLDSGKRLALMKEFISGQIVGHSEVIDRICETVKRGFAGFGGQRPLASFLFAGPPGVGKGQTAKALASFLFNDPGAVQVFNMGEFTERHSVAKLIGTGPGYVGHEQGGRLTESMYRKPFQILLFRDVEAAHPDVQELVAELIRSGMLTDGKGRRVYFSNTVVVLSLDLDLEEYFFASDARVGFRAGAQGGGSSATAEEVIRKLSKKAAGGLLDSVDERLVYFPLDKDQVLDVARLEVAQASRGLQKERDVSFQLSEAALRRLVEIGGYTRSGGARAMKQVLSRSVEALVADRLLQGEVRAGSMWVVDLEGNQFVLQESSSVSA